MSTTPQVATPGPCSAWIDGADVAGCGGELPDVGSDTAVLDAWAFMATQLAYELSGRLFNGECESLVRPCRRGCTCWDRWLVGWYWGGYGAGWPGVGFSGPFWRDEAGNRCGCGSESYQRLGGYPVREILEVKIDGAVLDPSGYRLVRYRDLLRLADPGPPVVNHRWPACQNLALDDDQPGTWSVRYTWGQDPPELGRMAAAQLARELYLACRPGAKCALPGKVSKVVRQGVTIEQITPIAKLLRQGSTGLAILDAFIAAENPAGLTRRPTVWSPDMRQYPRQVGQ